MKSNTVATSGNFRAVPLAEQLVSVKPITGPIGIADTLRQIYSGHDEFDFERVWTEQKKQWHMEEIKEAGNDYEI